MVTPVSTLPSQGLLLVEGRNDQQAVLHICDKHPYFHVGGEPDDASVALQDEPTRLFKVRSEGDVDRLINSIRGHIASRQHNSLGVIVDADTNSGKRWADIENTLNREKITLPENPEPGGTIIPEQSGHSRNPRIGIWVMPDNGQKGELEDFVAPMIPVEDPVWPLAQEYIDKIPEDSRKFPAHKTSKAKVHAWLAARQNPRQIGIAIHHEDLETSGPLCQSFLEWLTKLFS